MKIDNYTFGSIIVDNEIYNSDLILFPNKVLTNWCRENGHLLLIKDLKEIIKYKPDVLIVGTGADGVMEIASETKKELEKLKITLIEAKSAAACNIFNDRMEKGENAVGAFHLTC